MNRLYKQIAAVAASLLLLPTLPACSDEGGSSAPDLPETKYATLTITLGSRESQAATKAQEVVTTDENDTEYERHLADWKIIIVKKTDAGFVFERMISNDNPVNPAPGSENSTEVELEIGQYYKFYALANLSGLTESSKTAVETALTALKQGDIFKPENLTATLQNISAYVGTTYIPMSSYGCPTDANGQLIQEDNQPLPIELIRLLGKVSVDVENGLTEEVTINSIKVEKFRKEGKEQYLFPWDVATGTNLLLLSQNSAAVNIMNPLFPGNTNGQNTKEEGVAYEVAIAEDKKTIATNASQSFPFFVTETAQENQGNSGTDNIMITIGTSANKDTSPKETQFMFVRRNDWLKIPILLSNVNITFTPSMSHMPIGGLPATITIPEGAVIPEVPFNTQEHGGDVTVSFRINSVSSMVDPKVQLYESGDTYTAGEANPYSSAVVTEADNASGLFYNLPDQAASEAVAPWRDDLATTSALAITESTETTGLYSFTVTTQERANRAESHIQLTLVLKGTKDDGKEVKVTLPYTIIIENKGASTNSKS